MIYIYIYMVDTPKESNGDEAMEDDPLEKQPRHRHHRCSSNPHHIKNSDTSTKDDNNPDGAKDENNVAQPGFEQAEQEDGQASPKEQATDGESEDDNYMPLSEDEASYGDDEFIVPEDPVEQERFKRRLIATAKSLKKKQQQLQADQYLLTDRWTEVLAAEEYGLEHPTKIYPKSRLLPQLEEEALKPTLPAHDAADRPPHDRDKVVYQPKV